MACASQQTWLISGATCQEESVFCAIHFDLCVELAPSTLQPVPLIHNNVLPLQLRQAWPVMLAHQEVIAGQQYIKVRLA